MPSALRLIEEGFHSKIDPGISRAVWFLRNNGVETFSSCEGGEGHGYLLPTVRFEGGYSELLRAASLLIGKQFPVRVFRRVQRVLDGELEGPFNEVVFWEKVPVAEHDTLIKGYFHQDGV